VKIARILQRSSTPAPFELAGEAPAPGALALRAVDLRTSIRPTVAEVDCGALRRNLSRVRVMAGPGVRVYGVVKADAYGHGAVAVARVLAPACDALAVSLVEEGLELRAAGITCPILVLGAYYGGRHSEVLEEGLTPVVYDLADLERFGTVPARRRPRAAGALADGRSPSRAALHLKLDTGMNRLGFSAAGLQAALDRVAGVSGLHVEGVCTHFSSADLPDESWTREQLRRFATSLDLLRARGLAGVVVHAANSAAMARFPEARFAAVRPGLALYGAMPSPVVAQHVPAVAALEPALSLRTRIMALHEVAPGAAVSYGARWVAERASRIATLPIGYADGYPRHVEGAQVLVRGARVPVVGAVCMDMMMADVTSVPGAEVGDPVTLIGRDGAEAIGTDDLARWAGTVNYEILCGISKRVPRLYRDEGDLAAGGS
jgi:alanine racemase